MKTTIRSLCLGSLLAFPLTACNQTATIIPPTAYAMVTPSSFRMPEGTGCKGEIDRYRAILGNDLAMGHVHRSVYDRAEKEITRASATCAAGRETEAMRMVNATKLRSGYR
ncbi:hypothetical protein [Microvirga sp. 2TAF3]|uniref:hypothetical protein n=1 Tax=Microvirga sp. 2TAF3 TaxID=3233014 RepID=UPI003F9B7DBA